MAVELKMPALSPTMEEGTLAKWLVKEGDEVSSGDILAEIETDKATMEFEAVDEGKIAKILVPEGTDGVKVGAPIAILAAEGEDVKAAASAAPKTEAKPEPKAEAKPEPKAEQPKADETPKAAPQPTKAGERIKASPLAKRIAEDKGIDLSAVQGSGPGGRIVKADLEQAPAGKAAPAVAAAPVEPGEIPHEVVKLSNMRKTIARRLTEAKQTIPHIYLTVDIQLDALLKLRGELNASLQSRGVKLSVNDMLIKALAVALIEVPECNVSISGDQLLKYSRADVSVAVSIPGGLITPIVADAGNKSLSAIATEMKDLAARAREGKLQPHEYQGGTASISNMGMYGIKQFDAVINPPGIDTATETSARLYLISVSPPKATLHSGTSISAAASALISKSLTESLIPRGSSPALSSLRSLSSASSWMSTVR